jgi:agmatine/peptidylarginine deiminase
MHALIEQLDRASMTRLCRYLLVCLLAALFVTEATVREARSSRLRATLSVPNRTSSSLLGQAMSALHDPAPQVFRVGRQDAGSHRLAGEFEHQQALILSAMLVDTAPRLLADVVRAAAPTIAIVIVAPDATQEELAGRFLRQHGLWLAGVCVVREPHDSRWVRDYGPITALGPQMDQAILYDAEYLYGDGLRPLDDQFPRSLAAALQLSSMPLGLAADGGNLLSNGDGLFLTTEELAAQNGDRYPGEIAEALAATCGTRQLVFLESLEEELTGHVDLFATFTDRDTVVVGEYSWSVDRANAGVLNRNASLLRSVRTDRGRLRVARVPMPPNRDGVWRSHLNVVYANGTLLVPVFDATAPEATARCLETFQRLLPLWRVVPINADELAAAGGALHCVVLNLTTTGALLPALHRPPAQPRLPGLPRPRASRTS